MRFALLAAAGLLATAVTFVPNRVQGEQPDKPANQPKVTAFDGLGKHTRKVATQ